MIGNRTWIGSGYVTQSKLIMGIVGIDVVVNEVGHIALVHFTVEDLSRVGPHDRYCFAVGIYLQFNGGNIPIGITGTFQAIGNGTYDLPTLDDPAQPGTNDNNDPFGGNNGDNQAKLVAGGPVQIYSPGYRNAYDLVLTEAGRLYVTDNGPNAGWGGQPGGGCVNNTVNGGNTYQDQLHYVPNKGYYGGHPNPVRGNKNNTFRLKK